MVRTNVKMVPLELPPGQEHGVCEAWAGALKPGQYERPLAAPDEPLGCHRAQAACGPARHRPPPALRIRYHGSQRRACSPACRSGVPGPQRRSRSCSRLSRCQPMPGSSISSESSPVSSPATNQSSPVSTPKRGPLGPVIVPPGGHSVPSTPPVVTIAPTKTVNGLWRSEGRPVRERTQSQLQRQPASGPSPPPLPRPPQSSASMPQSLPIPSGSLSRSFARSLALIRDKGLWPASNPSYLHPMANGGLRCTGSARYPGDGLAGRESRGHCPLLWSRYCSSPSLTDSISPVFQERSEVTEEEEEEEAVEEEVAVGLG
ncbi:hypothetical protein P4O66_003316 [Electrophorus voltai]|uniref:Uncharacterized protein n=1 Tax=Electrophorus voltai TaxID=2609070 RepID=A0AAD8YP77_9TELE|nr:hypothetical protein P4O66_003316 [Electrophorus voltai]